MYIPRSPLVSFPPLQKKTQVKGNVQWYTGLPSMNRTKRNTQTNFTRCRHILKTVKNVTVAKFELSFTRCRNNLKTVGDLTAKTRWKTLMPKKCSYTLRTDQFRCKSVEKYAAFTISSVHAMPFSKCAG